MPVTLPRLLWVTDEYPTEQRGISNNQVNGNDNDNDNGNGQRQRRVLTFAVAVGRYKKSRRLSVFIREHPWQKRFCGYLVVMVTLVYP
jgi:hypothetical protein